PFQSVYAPAAGTWSSLPLMPEWVFIILALAGVTLLGTVWRPMFLALPLLLLALSASLAQAILGARHASFVNPPQSRVSRLRRRVLVAILYLLQPVARLDGRLRHGLTPWRWRLAPGLAHPLPHTTTLWS